MNKLDLLKESGYELYTKVEVGLPHFVWQCDVDLEHERNLHLSEETVLKLIDSGLNTREHIAAVMGIDDRMLRNIILNLLDRQALEYDQQEHLRLSVVGKRMLLNAKVRLTSTVENLAVRHDPYTETFRWFKPEYDLDDIQLRAAGRKRMPSVLALGKSQLEERYKEVQKLIEREGLPKDRLQSPGKREVLRVHALASKKVYRPADLEVWHNPKTHEVAWRITRDDHEEPEVTRILEQLEAEGHPIIPVDEAPESLAVPPTNEPLHEVATALSSRAEPNLLKTHGLRDALKQSIVDANKSLMIISPWLKTGAIDAELLSAFQRALESKPALQVRIGYGIETLPDVPRTEEDRRQHRALAKLESIRKKYPTRFHLKEIGNTHEKIIVVDNQYGIIASFNFLSFNPRKGGGPGVRREIGYRVTQHEDVNDLSRYVEESLSS